MNNKKLEEFNLIIGDGNYSSKYPNGEEFLDYGIPFLSASDFKDKAIDYTQSKKISPELHNQLKKGHVQKGDLLIVVRGNGVGKTGYIDDEIDECNINAQLAFIRSNDASLDNEYLYYNMKYNFEKLKSLATGSAQPQLVIGNLVKYSLSVPSIENQTKIRTILSNIDKKIKLNNEINNNLYEEAVALYKDKFKGIDQGKKTIGDYIVPKRGKNLLTRDAVGGDIPVVAGGIAPSAYHNQFNTKSPVITISASGANAGYTNLWNVPVWASDCSYIDDSITKNVYFWYIVLKTRQNEIFDAQTGSAQPHIYPQHIAEMSIGELNIAEVKKYSNLVAPLFKMIGENQKENKKLFQLRDTLLPKLMNGEIDLDNIEI